MDDLSRFCCLNSACPDYGKRGAGNLSVTSRYGPAKARRMLRCRTCKAPLLRAQGHAPVRRPLSPEKADAVLAHLDEGCGVRQTERLVGSTATPWSVRPLGRRACPRRSRRARGFFPQTREVQFDEKWSFVAKKEKNCDPADPADDHKGDWWDHVAFDPEHRLVLAVVPGRAVGRERRSAWSRTSSGTGGRRPG